MLRRSQRGVEVCAPVHDAVLIGAPLDQLDTQVAAMREAMAEASRAVLDGFELRTDAALIRNPGRYRDARGAAMWATVMELLAELDQQHPGLLERVNVFGLLNYGEPRWLDPTTATSLKLRVKTILAIN